MLDRTLLTADKRGTIALWDLSDPSVLSPRALDTGAERSPPVFVGFDAKGVLALAAWPDGTIRRWDVASGAAIATLQLRDARGDVPWRHRSHALRVDAAAMPTVLDDPKLLVATHDGAVSQVDLRTLRGRPLVAPGTIESPVTTLAGSLLTDVSFVATTARSIIVWRNGRRGPTRANAAAPTVARDDGASDRYYVADGLGVEAVSSNPVDPPAVSFLPPPADLPAATIAATGPGGVAIGHDDGTVSLLDLRTDGGGGIALEPGTERSLARFMPDGLLLTTEGSDAHDVTSLAAVQPGAKDVRTGEPHRMVRTYRRAASWWPQAAGGAGAWYVNDADATEDMVVAVGPDPTGGASIVVWDARTGRPLKRLPLATRLVNPTDAPWIASQVRLLPKKHLLAAYIAAQGTLVLWSTRTWMRVASIPVGTTGGFSVAPDESHVILAGVSDKQADVWTGPHTSHVKLVSLDRRTVDRRFATRDATRAEVAPDGHAIALAEGDHLRILSPDGRRDLVGPIRLDHPPVTAIAWRPDSRVLAAATGDGTVIVDVAARRIATTLRSPSDSSPIALSWSPSGEVLVTTNGTGDDSGPGYAAARASFWRLDRGSLRERMCRLSAGSLSATQWRSDVGPGIAYQRPCRYAAPRPAAPRPPRDPVVAFVEEGGVVLVAGADGHAVRIGRFPESWLPTDTLTVAADGTVAWTAEGRLSVLRHGVLRSWACQCNRVVFDGSTAAAVTTDGSALLTFSDRATAAKRVAFRGLPRHGATLLALHGQDALVAGFDHVQSRNAPATMVALHDGRVRARRTRPDSWPSSAPVQSPDRRQVAFRVSPSYGLCHPADSVAIVDVATARLTRPALPADVKDVRSIRSVSWPADSTLSAVLAGPPCNRAGDSFRWVPGGQLLRLEGERFVRTPARDYDIALHPGLTARLTGRVPTSRQRARLVLRRDDGRTTTVATGVTAMRLRP